MDDWSVSATAPAAASGEASNLAQSVTLTQARFFMDDIYLCQVSPFAQFIASRRLRNSSRLVGGRGSRCVGGGLQACGGSTMSDWWARSTPQAAARFVSRERKSQRGGVAVEAALDLARRLAFDSSADGLTLRLGVVAGREGTIRGPSLKLTFARASLTCHDSHTMLDRACARLEGAPRFRMTPTPGHPNLKKQAYPWSTLLRDVVS
jgi:hypothetical protein